MADISIGGHIYMSNDAALQIALADAHKNKARPLCMCTHDGVEMYVAKISEQYVIKRMPDSGERHSAHCDSYEPPPEVSGFGEVLGQAIQEDMETGSVSLKFDFALTRSAGRAPPESVGTPADTVKANGKKLTLRSVLHYLWDEAGMSKWSPRMEGRRSWFVLHKYLSQAAIGKSTKGSALASSLFIPEPFFSDRRDEITRARNTRFADLHTPSKGARKLMILVGEVKEFGPARYGHKVTIKQMPDCPFMLDASLFKRLEKRFEVEFELWRAFETTHLMSIATFGVGASGVATIEEMALMLTTENWIPFETLHEKELVDALTRQSRHFVRSLRYNMAADRPLAAAVVTDTQPKPTAMYILDGATSDDRIVAFEELTEHSSLASWTWNVSEQSIPLFPPSGRAVGHAGKPTSTTQIERPDQSMKTDRA